MVIDIGIILLYFIVIFYTIMSDKYFTVGTEGGEGGGGLRPPITTPTPGQALTGAWHVRLSMTIMVKLDQMNH